MSNHGYYGGGAPPAGNAPPPYQQQYAPPPGPPPGHNAAFPNPHGAPPAAQSNNPYNQAVPPVQPPQRANSVQASAGNFNKGSAAAGLGRSGSIKEDQLEYLRAYDTIVIVDDSASMNVNELPGGGMGPSRWEEARDALAGLAEIAVRYDPDGIDVHFLNNERCLEGCKSGAEIMRLFDSIEPNGATPTGTKLEMLLLDYMDAIERFKETRQGPQPRKRNYLIITDGAASDDPAETIIATARRLDRGNFPLAQVGIQMIQVGNDPDATAALKQLDDELGGSCRDITDTIPYAGMALSADRLIKALLGGINRRFDKA